MVLLPLGMVGVYGFVAPGNSGWLWFCCPWEWWVVMVLLPLGMVGGYDIFNTITHSTACKNIYMLMGNTTIQNINNSIRDISQYYPQSYLYVRQQQQITSDNSR